MNTGCEDCFTPYDEFPELLISLWAWKQISTNKDETGLLCPTCMCKRLSKLNINCEGAFTSGPINSIDYESMFLLRKKENLELKRLK